MNKNIIEPSAVSCSSDRPPPVTIATDAAVVAPIESSNSACMITSTNISKSQSKCVAAHADNDDHDADDVIIIIDSSSDDDAVSIHNNKRRKRSPIQVERKSSHRASPDLSIINTSIDGNDAHACIDAVNDLDSHVVMEVTGLPLKEAIALRNNHSCIQEAITAHFEHMNGNATSTTITTDASSAANILHQSTDKDKLVTEDKEKLCANPNTDSAQLIATPVPIVMLHHPLQKWIDTVQRCKQLNVQYIDQEFPPNTSSLDGRRVLSIPTKNTISNDSNVRSASTSSDLAAIPDVVRCRCGKPAAIKTVQKDGPNYGRFFLACGKPRPSRKKQALIAKRKHNQSDDGIIVIDGEQDDGNADATIANKEKDTSKSREIAAKQCQFFQWDDKHVQGTVLSNRSLMHKLTWFRFDTRHGYYLTHPKGSFRPDHVMQGAMGDCWFLSALAVVAEKQYLIQKLLPHQEFNDTGCYEVNFCLDGQWTSIVVDSLLPVLARTPKILKNAKGTQNQQKPNSRGGVQIADGITVQPAFAAGNVSWPAIIEKAYAKVHGSYSRLSGGFISEALYDLTGAPIERIHFHKEFDYDQLFARLLSFASAGFLMGIATSAGGDGLVASHAYSLLGVYEIHDVVVGEQKKVTNFFNKQEKVDNDVIIVEPPINELKSAVEMRETVRLVCIRNPWGVREWKGTWSASSDQWTEKIRRQLGNDICKQGDGTFFMSFHDMIKRFDHMDVAKCQEGWKSTARGGAIKLHKSGDPLFSCALVYHCSVNERTWGFISIVQRKKRANATTQFWYTDFSIMTLKRKHGDKRWGLAHCVLQGVERMCNCELFFDPEFEYCVIPFSNLSGREEMEFGAQIDKKTSAPFQFTTYSANEVIVKAQVRSSLGHWLPLEFLHTSLLLSKKKVSHTLGPRAVLLTIAGDGCDYFVVLNAGNIGFVLNLKVELNGGVTIAHGLNNDTHSIPPISQCIILVLTNDGRQSSPGNVNFKFKTDCNDLKVSNDIKERKYSYIGVESRAPLSLAGESICSKIDSATYRCGEGTLDHRLWNTVM